MKQVDEIDLKILDMLTEDARRSFQEIADVIGMTDVTVRRRVKDLVKRGVIKRFTLEVDKEKLGKTLQAVVRLEMKLSEQKRIMKEIKKLDEVECAYYLAGKCGLWLKVSLEDMDELEEFIKEKLSREAFEGINNVETCIILKNLV
ncbi:AsnC family transcriptional regulator [Candidatus Bathyarchaeota archaeon]|nr:AsnC family transcriptional regulator [Candidatus Bathyarchaeota archaeon]